MLADVIANAKNYERNLIRKGRVEGEKAKSIEMATEMLRDGKPMTEIIKYSKLTEKEVKDLEKTLN